MASVKPGDGGIVSLYGGEDYAKRQQNAAMQDKMQAGSTFKIFTLIAALQSEKSASKTRFDGRSPSSSTNSPTPMRPPPTGAAAGEELRRRVLRPIDLLRATAARSTPSTPSSTSGRTREVDEGRQDAGVRSTLAPNMSNVLAPTTSPSSTWRTRTRPSWPRASARRTTSSTDPLRRRDGPDDQVKRRPSRSSTGTSWPTSSRRCRSPSTGDRRYVGENLAAPPRQDRHPRELPLGLVERLRPAAWRRPSASSAAARRARS